MKPLPPRWADRFLQWYCRPDLLEEIQGDAYELFYRNFNKNKNIARISFAWNVLRFFRMKNIRKRKVDPSSSNLSPAMIRNMFLVAIRNFMRQPGHSVLNVVGLSAGFTCAFLILLWIAQEVSFDRFHKDSNSLYMVMSHVQTDAGFQTYPVASSAIDVSSIPEVEAMVPVSYGDRWPHELCFRPERAPDACIYLSGFYSTESFFSAFNFPILKGDPHPLKQPNQIAISEKMALSLFGSENAIGKPMKIDGMHEVTVVSVFQNPPANSTLQFDFVMPFAILKKEWGVNDEQFYANFFSIYVKATPGTTAGALTAKLNDKRVLTEQLISQKVSYEAFPFADYRLHGKFEDGKNTGGRIEYVRLFAVIALLVVLMAVINFVNMTTARASTRAKEIGIRKVTGAFRSGIVAQFMGESFLMVLASFVLAALMTQLALPFFNALLSEPVSLQLYSGWMPLLLLAFLVLVAVLAGIYPAFVLSSFQPVKILKDQVASYVTGSNRLRKSLLVIQLSVSIGIIIFSGVMYRQLNYIINKDLGFDRQNMIRVEPTYKLLQKMDAFKIEMEKSPVLRGVTASNLNPLEVGGGNTGVVWPGKPKDLRVAFSTIGCTYEFPELFGLKILEGRNFLPKEMDTVNTEVLVTKEAITAMGLTNPIGEHIQIGETPCVIIGIVNDFHTASLHAQRLPAIIHRISIFHTGRLYVKYEPGRAKEAVEALQQAYNKLEPSFTMKYWFQDDTFNEIYKTEVTASRLALLFTVVALIIAVIGIVGLATYNVIRKTKEIGIRRVFGASAQQILGMLTNEFSLVMIVAALIATPLTWYAANQWLSGFAYHASMPWWLYVVSFVGIAVLTVSIICAQAMKAVVANPTKALRSE